MMEQERGTEGGQTPNPKPSGHTLSCQPLPAPQPSLPPRGSFSPSLGKDWDFKGSLFLPCQPQLQPGADPPCLKEKTWIISNLLC